MKNSEIKQIAVECMENACKESQNLLIFAQLLLEGENLDQAKEPVDHTDCSFGVWLSTDGQVYKKETWFNKVVKLHEKSHEAYSKLYHETLKIYNPKTHDELREFYIHLETHSHELVGQLEIVMETFSNMPDSVDEQLGELKEELALPPEENEPTLILEEALPQPQKEVEIISNSNDLQKQLKRQDLKQLEHEKQLLKLEIKQLKERKQLSEQGVEQLKQYQLLKQKEQKHLEDENIKLELVKQKELNTKKLELEEVVKEKDQKQQELLKMEQVSHKFDQKKHEEKNQDKELLKQLEQKQELISVEIDKLDEQQKSRQEDLDQLEQKVLSTKQDIQDLLDQKQKKSEELQSIEGTITQNQQEIDDTNLKQQHINRQKHNVEESKQKDLQLLEEKQEKLNQGLKQLEQELQDLTDKKESSQIATVIKQLDDEQILKSRNLEILEHDQQEKQQKLEQTEQAYLKIENEIQQFDSIELEASKLKPIPTALPAEEVAE